ncbi:MULTISPECIES: DnaJ C-terminal domain-containing protein [Ensifer]|jgi:DnaJ-class molecular chaperone|uniref:DnaJ domain-containing protein n=1 Tax=Ensifer canadensis TaxID=555315 RepID=A0AAW4FFC8_9HYPH|nr:MULTISPECIES: DnaJ C-terminal domain-containing protein [Ensifer]AHK43635.1 chaperone protein DnaJ [Ensifer adhaerens OV14]KQU72301.1 molecular chaperone DnaJ [Ensifer sp. Root31]KQW44489.1 molecular chaperone DnaJ [Ensifer sp. Root1252]KQW84653.1 molecular chaperone DnaJ [Ensifer sp. Root127]KQY71626.1 molecular chaperone DnaJ [Ensifer sp. Root142]
MRDPYAILGVRRTAGQDEIKAAWRSVAKAIHPDHNQDDPTAAERFAEAGKAYELLRDPKLRSRYDYARREAELRRMEAMKAKMRGPEPEEQPVDAETAEEAVSRIFGTESRTSAARPAPKPAAAKAPERPAAAPEPKPEPVTEPKQEAVAKTEPPLMQRAAAPAAELVAAIVRRIRGRAAKPADKVPDLAVDLTVTIQDLIDRQRLSLELPDGETFKVQIPPGAVDGQTIRLAEQGYRVTRMTRGDVVVTLRVDQSGDFRTSGLDLFTTLSVDLQSAVLGCEHVIATPIGEATVVVPAWSGSDKVIRVDGFGLPGAYGARGDLLVELRLILRDTPDDKVTDLMKSLRDGFYL